MTQNNTTFLVVVVISILWILAAIVLATIKRAPVLWGRAIVILTVVYGLGAMLGIWPWEQGKFLVDFCIQKLGG